MDSFILLEAKQRTCSSSTWSWAAKRFMESYYGIFGSEARTCFSSSLGTQSYLTWVWPRHLTSVFTVLFVSSDLGLSRDFSLTAHRHSTENPRARKTLPLTPKSQGTLSEVVTLHRWHCSGVASLEELPNPHSGAKLHSALLLCELTAPTTFQHFAVAGANLRVRQHA